jgi:hypothetical protein
LGSGFNILINVPVKTSTCVGNEKKYLVNIRTKYVFPPAIPGVHFGPDPTSKNRYDKSLLPTLTGNWHAFCPVSRYRYNNRYMSMTAICPGGVRPEAGLFRSTDPEGAAQDRSGRRTERAA